MLPSVFSAASLTVAFEVSEFDLVSISHQIPRNRALRLGLAAKGSKPGETVADAEFCLSEHLEQPSIKQTQSTMTKSAKLGVLALKPSCQE